MTVLDRQPPQLSESVNCRITSEATIAGEAAATVAYTSLVEGQRTSVVRPSAAGDTRSIEQQLTRKCHCASIEGDGSGGSINESEGAAPP
jgi:hypothetical protein